MTSMAIFSSKCHVYIADDGIVVNVKKVFSIGALLRFVSAHARYMSSLCYFSCSNVQSTDVIRDISKIIEKVSFYHFFRQLLGGSRLTFQF